MHGRAGDLDAVLERLALRVEAGERRQQRRVNVEDAHRKGVEQRLADKPHEAGEADEVDARGAISVVDDRRVVGVAVRVVARVRGAASRFRPRARAAARARRRDSR